jgi:hypothetical protein
VNRTLIDQSLDTRRPRDQAVRFAEWLESMAAHVRWCVDLPAAPWAGTADPPEWFQWADEHGDLARMWIANNVGGDFT